MSGLANSSIGEQQTNIENANQPPEKTHSNYKGFVAGVFSGITKLTVGHPFDTIKVRLQTTDKSRFKGPVDCVLQTVRHEGVRGLYKGINYIRILPITTCIGLTSAP